MTVLLHRHRSSQTPAPAARWISIGILAFLACWGGAVAWLAAHGVFANLYMPYVAILVAAGIALPTLGYFLSPRLQLYITAIGLYPLTVLHVWRVPAALAFFAYGLAGALPTAFWVLAGVGDLIAGLYAARLLFGKGDVGYYWRFHLFGFADFLVAVGTGLTFTLLQDPRMETIAVLPMALIPLFGVGISGASHLMAFHQLSRSAKPA